MAIIPKEFIPIFDLVVAWIKKYLFGRSGVTYIDSVSQASAYFNVPLEIIKLMFSEQDFENIKKQK